MLTRDPKEDLTYSKQFFDITEQGHTRPTPRIGAPAAHWHIAVWPNTVDDPNHAITRDQITGKQRSHEDIIKTRENDIQKLQNQVNELADMLRKRGAVVNYGPVRFKRQPSILIDGGMTNSVDSIGLTLWWSGTKEPQTEVGKDWRPTPDHIRVRTHIEIHDDYHTFSFYMDIGKPYNCDPVYSSMQCAAEGRGEPRRYIFQHIERVQRICERRIHNGLIERDVIPEEDVSKEEGAQLLAAADYLYDGLWNEFCAAFGIENASFSGKYGKIFANFRGLVVPTAGCDPKTLFDYGEAVHQRLLESENPGLRPLERFDSSEEEPNAVVKAYWPFVRRFNYGADYRDWIACTIFKKRAIFLTSLGSPSQFEYAEEGKLERDVPASESLPPPFRRDDPANESVDYDDEAPTTVYRDRPAPFRELYLTKYQPHPAQLGRMMERFNSLGTYRLYALKNAAIVKDAGNHVRMYGQEVSEIARRWAYDRGVLLDSEPVQPEPDQFSGIDEYELARKAFRRQKALHDEKLSRLSTKIEQQLTRISIQLNSLGDRAVGGLQFRITRSRRHARLFQRFVSTADIEQIPTWLSYDEFAKFGLIDAFESIEMIGDRLNSLRHRLYGNMEFIQTGAIASQTEATRDNTYSLEQILGKLQDVADEAATTNWRVSALTILVGVISLVIAAMASDPENLMTWMKLVGLIVPENEAVP